MHFGEFCHLGFDYIVQSVYLRWGWQQRWFTNFIDFLAGRPAAVLTGWWDGGQGGHLMSAEPTVAFTCHKNQSVEVLVHR